MRKVCYVTGTRADFGLMQSTLMAIHNQPELSLSLLVTGMHLLPAYGETWKEVETTGLTIGARVPVNLAGNSGAEMAISLGHQIIGFTRALQELKPNILLLLGDRGEMLAGAIAALHLNIHIVHIHGGERSGTVDEPVRHAISKMAHYHLTATENSRGRLIRMGEQPANIFVTGAPGLDSIYQAELLEPNEIFPKYNLDIGLPLLLILFHPVVQQASESESQMQALLDAAIESGMQVLVVMPNADAGRAAIARQVEIYRSRQLIKSVVHVPRVDFLSLIAGAQVMSGNSSSGIIEAASLGTPVVNIGDRQKCRERNANVLDAAPVKNRITTAITRAKEMKGQVFDNVYGDGNAGQRIVECLTSLSLSTKDLEKLNAY